MALHIRDAETDELVRELAELRKIGLTDAIKLAVGNELKRGSLRDRIRPIQEEVRNWGRSGPKADKDFFDDLSGDP